MSPSHAVRDLVYTIAMSVRSINEPPRATSEDSRGVLDKAIDLLDVLAEGRDMTAAELAERTGQPRSSVYRLLMTLRQRGFVESGPHRSSFRLGLEFLHLGGVVMSRFDVRQAAQPVMERLHSTTGETIYLCIRSGNQSVCIERIDGRFVHLVALQLGGTLPLHVGASSRILLAFQPEHEWHDYVEQQDLVAFTASTVVAPDDVLASLHRIREQGFAINDEDVTLGVASCGAPIFDHRDLVIAAISVAGFREAILGERHGYLCELVQAAASEISRVLGHGKGLATDQPASFPEDSAVSLQTETTRLRQQRTDRP
jgi:DNA-binding IclR family transcriptional regulator